MLAAATAANDIDLDALRREKISVYLGIYPADLERLSLLVNLFIQQVSGLNTRATPDGDPSLRTPVLLLLDEVVQMGRLVQLERGIAYLAGYGLRVVLVCQSPAQLDAV